MSNHPHPTMDPYEQQQQQYTSWVDHLHHPNNNEAIDAWPAKDHPPPPPPSHWPPTTTDDNLKHHHNSNTPSILTPLLPHIPSTPSSATTTANPYRLLVLRQPEEQHRARYLSEGSRGAIKDRSGTSHCTIQLCNYFRPTRIELYATTASQMDGCGSGGVMAPHPMYRLIPVSGKASSATPCKKVIAHDKIECLEVTLRPEGSMTAVLDCIGILKICTYDAAAATTKSQNRQRDRKKGLGAASGAGKEPSCVSPTTSNCSSTSSNCSLTTSPTSAASNSLNNIVRIAMRAYVPAAGNSIGGGGGGGFSPPNGTNGSIPESFTLVHALSDPIRCVQQLGVPEVLKMSLSSAPASGGAELFLIGRNFDRNTKVVFREYREDGALGWAADAAMDKQFHSQCHIVCTIPPYYNTRRGGSVSVTVVCASKASHPRSFSFTPSDDGEEDEEDWRPPVSPKLVSPATAFYQSAQPQQHHFDFTNRLKDTLQRPSRVNGHRKRTARHHQEDGVIVQPTYTPQLFHAPCGQWDQGEQGQGNGQAMAHPHTYSMSQQGAGGIGGGGSNSTESDPDDLWGPPVAKIQRIG